MDKRASAYINFLEMKTFLSSPKVAFIVKGKSFYIFLLYSQANVERWRNKMRHREKLRQYMRDKEQEREQMLKQLEKERKEGNHQSMAEVHKDKLV